MQTIKKTWTRCTVCTIPPIYLLIHDFTINYIIIMKNDFFH